MKKFLSAAFLLLITGAIAVAVYQSHERNKQIEQETSDFVTDTINAISEKWDAHALVKRADPGLIKAMGSQGQSVFQLFDVYRNLGVTKSPPNCALKDISTFESTSGSYTSASYNCDAGYENGQATVHITIRRGKSEDDWRVYYLNVDSPLFRELNYPRTK